MTITLSLMSIVVTLTSIASAIVAVSAAWKVLSKPHKDVQNKFKEYDGYLARDKERLDELERVLKILGKDNEMELRAIRDMINHLRTDNNTGEMEKIEDDIDGYLISRLNNIQY